MESLLEDKNKNDKENLSENEKNDETSNYWKLNYFEEKSFGM